MLNIAIIGGSITGCIAASRLLQCGHKVTVYEKSKTPLIDMGAGLTIMAPLIAQLKNLRLLNDTVTLCNADNRRFFVKDPHKTKYGRKIWNQDLTISSLHWETLYSNFKARIPTANYQHDKKAVSLTQLANDGVNINFENGTSINVDLAIFADGHSSIARNILQPSVQKNKCGYVAWRGTIPYSKIKDISPFEQSIPYYVYPHGHCLLYPVYYKEEKYLNWVMYEVLDDTELQTILTDIHGITHQSSISPGDLSSASQTLLHSHAQNLMPEVVADVICHTQKPFMQVIYDMHVPTYVQGRVILMGDAAATLRPHVGSNAAKAIQDALALADWLDQQKNVDTALLSWNQQQWPMGNKLHQSSVLMGDALVLNTPDWQHMNQELMNEWWQKTMSGNVWNYVKEKQ